MIKRIEIPYYLNQIVKTQFNFPNSVRIFTVDVETVKGIPHTIQLYHNDLNEEFFNKPIIKFIDRYSILDEFIKYMYDNFSTNKTNVVFFHNLSYDIPCIFYQYMNDLENNLIDSNEDDTLNGVKEKGLDIKIFKGKLWFCTCRLNKLSKLSYHSSFKIVDSGNFIKGSLDNLGKELKLEHKKFNPPEDFIKFNLNTTYTDELGNTIKYVDYALNDIMVEYDLAKYILNICKDFNIRIPVTIAQMAQYIFTNNFIKTKEDKIILPNIPINYYSIMSYHGGKSRYYYDKPYIWKKLYMLDVNSMYPYAMLNLPNFINSNIIKTDRFINNKEGVYKISGFVKSCKYPIICNAEFKYLNNTPIENLYITSYELREALETNEIELEEVKGYLIKENIDSYNPLGDYVKYFYKLKKETSKEDNRYMMYKTLMNSLYGKFIQNIKYTNDSDFTYNEELEDYLEDEKLFKAGGLFNPLIATLITGFGRAYIHKFEHKYNSIDTTTDSIKTTMKPYKEDIDTEIGLLTMENGGAYPAITFRNKFYVIFGDKIKFKGHGFHIRATRKRPYKPIEELLKMYLNNEDEYIAERMVKVNESIIQNIQPLVMRDFKKHLNIDFDNIKNG